MHRNYLQDILRRNERMKCFVCIYDCISENSNNLPVCQTIVFSVFILSVVVSNGHLSLPSAVSHYGCPDVLRHPQDSNEDSHGHGREIHYSKATVANSSTESEETSFDHLVPLHFWIPFMQGETPLCLHRIKVVLSYVYILSSFSRICQGPPTGSGNARFRLYLELYTPQKSLGLHFTLWFGQLCAAASLCLSLPLNYCTTH